MSDREETKNSYNHERKMRTRWRNKGKNFAAFFKIISGFIAP